VKGPFGKGLNIRKGANGTYVAFAAGTGILPFMDLVAYLARKQTGQWYEDENKHAVGDNFTLILFASFPRQRDAIGLKLL
jgi:ferredoxin-NADP reductase